LLPTARRNLDMALAALRHAREFAESGKPVFERLRLDTLASEAVALLEPVWREKGLGVSLVASNGLEISADRILLQRLLANLLSNAIKASPRGSSLTVSVQPLAGSAARARVQLVIEDHGPGLEVRDTAVNESIQPSAGLGLRICRQIVELHGGGLELRDRADGGTQAVVELSAAHH
jgi:signal transduction histidine kinase